MKFLTILCLFVMFIIFIMNDENKMVSGESVGNTSLKEKIHIDDSFVKSQPGPDREIQNRSDKNNFSKYFSEKEIGIITNAGKRNGLTDNQMIILFAIRKAENGGPGREWGILNAKANSFDLQAGWCAATIKKNYARWESAGKPDDFVTFLGGKYCPVGAANDPKGLNVNWVRNVKTWIHKLID